LSAALHHSDRGHMNDHGFLFFGYAHILSDQASREVTMRTDGVYVVQPDGAQNIGHRPVSEIGGSRGSASHSSKVVHCMGRS